MAAGPLLGDRAESVITTQTTFQCVLQPSFGTIDSDSRVIASNLKFPNLFQTCGALNIMVQSRYVSLK